MPKRGVISVKEIKIASPFGYKTPCKIYFKNRLSSTVEECHRKQPLGILNLDHHCCKYSNLLLDHSPTGI